MSNAWQEVYTPPKKTGKTRVSWALKNWNEFTEQDKAGLAAHMKTFDTKEQAETYRKYLIHWCGVPKEVLV